MNFKKNWKRFWTLSRASEGFTLVELIVVIAIMAILAGVAVPAYSGYIKKAEKAGDLQLLGAVNTAFAAAVMDRDQKSATELANGSISFNISDMLPSDYSEEFEIYFAGNTGTFKVIKNLVFQGGVFVDPADVSEITLSYGGGIVKISGAALQSLQNSTFATSETLGGITGLLNKVHDVTGLATEMIEDDLGGFGTMVKSKAYSDAMAQAMGYADSSDPAFATKLTEIVTEKAKELAGEGGDYTAYMNQASNQILANNAVLVAAKNTAGKTTEELMATLKTGVSTSTVKDLMASDDTSGEGVAQAALLYSMYTAYAYSDQGTDADREASKTVEGFLANVNSDGFKNYLNDTEKTGQAQTDLEGYLAAMQTVNNSTGNEAASSLLLNGFNDPELVKLMEGLAG